MILLLCLMGCSVATGGLSIPEITRLQAIGYQVYNCTMMRQRILPANYSVWLIVPRDTVVTVDFADCSILRGQ